LALVETTGDRADAQVLDGVKVTAQVGWSRRELAG
jgi:hypothetical protein